MGQSHRTGRQEAARKRRQQRQILHIGGVVVIVALVLAAALIIFTGSDDDPPIVADVPDTTSNATWEAESFTGGPRLAVDRTDHNEGDVPYGHTVSAAFRLRNVGDEPLTLDETSVNTLEGC
jgi:hypothetical protein